MDMTKPTIKLGRVLLICAPALLLGACAQPEAAGPTAAQAMAAAQAAQQTANQALQTAQQAETDAQAARTAASSMYQRSLHK
jgi:PBP1b-binding outer membrane lipoprotein LpoB